MEEAKLKKLITESRELAKALDKFADELEKTGKKHTELSKLNDDDYDDFVVARHMQAVHSAAKNGFPHFVTELTEDEFDESEGLK